MSTYNGINGVGPPPTGTTTTTKSFLGGVPSDYKAKKETKVELDALGRVIVPDGAPIADASREVHRSDATMTINTTSAKVTKGKKTVNDGLMVTESNSVGKDGKSKGTTYWIDGRSVTRQKVSNKGKPDTYKYFWASGQDVGKEVDQSKYQRTKEVDDNQSQWVTTSDKGQSGTAVKTTYVTPQYFQGAQYAPASMPPDQIAALQRKLIDAGVLAKGYTTFGRWDDASSTAYEKILGYANQQGNTDEEVMQQWATYGGSDGVVGKKLTVANPEEVAAVVKQASSKVLGRTLSDSEVAQLVAGYQSLDRSQQEAAAAANATVQQGLDATAPEAISPETYATNTIRQQHQGESKFVTGVDRMNTFYSMLGEAG